MVSGWRERGRAAAIVALLHLALAGPVSAAEPLPAACAGRVDGPFAVARVEIGAGLVLGDGREVRLIGVLPPSRLLAGDDRGAGTRARDVVWTLITGRPIYLHLPADVRDRYGRLPAQVRIGEAADGNWLQAALVSAGHMQVVAEIGGAGGACLGRLVALEAEARTARRGGWATGDLTVIEATAVDTLTARMGTHQIIEGRVVRASRYGRAVYLNFGRRWKDDFTVIVKDEALRRHPDWGKRLTALKGQRVRVRGFLLSSGGPMIEVEEPAALEVIEPAR